MSFALIAHVRDCENLETGGWLFSLFISKFSSTPALPGKVLNECMLMIDGMDDAFSLVLLF